MAKDPAFLFYPGDYVAGTMHLDFECKGAYMDLLMLQFQKDHMTIHMIKQVLGHKFDHIWSLISDKFQEKEGIYWNERLRDEKIKRVKFCSSRQKNRNSQKKEKQHMSLHMENENSIVESNTKLVSNGWHKGDPGKKFSDNGKGVIFEDGIYQPLGFEQKISYDKGTLNPRDVKRGLIY